MTDEEIIGQLTLGQIADRVNQGEALTQQGRQRFQELWGRSGGVTDPAQRQAYERVFNAATPQVNPYGDTRSAANSGYAPGAASPVVRGGGYTPAAAPATTGTWVAFRDAIGAALGRVTQNPLREQELQYAIQLWQTGQDQNAASVAYKVWRIFRNKPVSEGGELQPGQPPADENAVWQAISGQSQTPPGGGPPPPANPPPTNPPPTNPPPSQPPPEQLPPGPGGPGQIGMAQGQAWYRTRTGLKTIGMMFAELKASNRFTPEMLAGGVTDANILAMYSQDTGMTPIPTTQAEVDAAFPQSTAQQQFEFNREMTLSEIAANPRSMAQNLINAGMTPEQVGSFLNTLPFVQSLIGQGAIYAPGTPAAPGATPQAAATSGSVMPTADNRNPNFQFMSGRQLPVRETMGLIEGQSPKVDILSGLASYSGQQPTTFWADYQKYLPKGEKNPLTQYA